MDKICTCDFCNDYCYAKYFAKRFADPDYRTDFFACLTDRILHKQTDCYISNHTRECRKLIFCPTCGRKFESEEFEIYYEAFLKETF